MQTTTAFCQVNDLTVSVTTNSSAVLRHLDTFYSLKNCSSSEPSWRIKSLVDTPPFGISLNPFGVGYHSQPESQTLTLWAEREENLAITTRKCVREVLVNHWEEHRYTMLHASAIYRGNNLIVFVSDKRAGKTTLALRSVLEHAWRYVANDHGSLYRQAG